MAMYVNVEEFFQNRMPYVKLRLGKIFKEEKLKAGLYDKDITLFISKEIWPMKLNLKRHFVYDNISWKWSGSKGKKFFERYGVYGIQITEDDTKDEKEFRKLCRHELAHIKYGHCDFLDKLNKKIPESILSLLYPFLIILLEPSAIVYGMKRK